MGDRVAVMKDGILQQVDTPLRLYDKPVNLFVAGFIGSPQMNLLAAHAKDGKAQIGDYLVPVDPAASKQLGAGHNNITVGVRPEAWRLVTQAEGGLPVKVTVVEELGADAFVYGTSGVEGTPSNVIVRVSRPRHRAQGRHALRDHRPAPRARLRHRHRRAAQRLTAVPNGKRCLSRLET